jgi:hypothetical protein
LLSVSVAPATCGDRRAWGACKWVHDNRTEGTCAGGRPGGLRPGPQRPKVTPCSTPASSATQGVERQPSHADNTGRLVRFIELRLACCSAPGCCLTTVPGKLLWPINSLAGQQKALSQATVSLTTLTRTPSAPAAPACAPQANGVAGRGQRSSSCAPRQLCAAACGPTVACVASDTLTEQRGAAWGTAAGRCGVSCKRLLLLLQSLQEAWHSISLLRQDAPQAADRAAVVGSMQVCSSAGQQRRACQHAGCCLPSAVSACAVVQPLGFFVPCAEEGIMRLCPLRELSDAYPLPAAVWVCSRCWAEPCHACSGFCPTTIGQDATNTPASLPVCAKLPLRAPPCTATPAPVLAIAVHTSSSWPLVQQALSPQT